MSRKKLLCYIEGLLPTWREALWVHRAYEGEWRILSFPFKSIDPSIASEILRGALDKKAEIVRVAGKDKSFYLSFESEEKLKKYIIETLPKHVIDCPKAFSERWGERFLGREKYWTFIGKLGLWKLLKRR